MATGQKLGLAFPASKGKLFCSLLATFGRVKMPVSAEEEECRIRKGNRLI